MDIQRRTLPIYKYRDEILFSVQKYRTTIIVGETGSGKTTQIPQYLHESGWTANGRMICCTQPRRVSTVSIAKRVAQEMKDEIGNITGYAIRFDSKLSVETRIKFMTDGMLLSELMIDPLLSQYSVLILDEAHERSINIDLLLGLILKILRIRLDLRLIISSATVDAMKFKRFFSLKQSLISDTSKTATSGSKYDVNVLCVEGRTFPVETFYLSTPSANYIRSAVETAVHIHQSMPRGDILVFLTGESEIYEAVELCESLIGNDGNSQNVSILPMFAGLRFSNQLKVFRKCPREVVRKIIFATNIAETAITIDGIVYVVDCGFSKSPSFDPLSGISSLFVTPISRATANQRRGRGGRVCNGKCYRLYPEAIYHANSLGIFRDFDIPEIQRCDLTECILKLKSLGIENPLGFDWLSPPPIRAVTYALELLYALHIIDSDSKLREPFGRRIAELPCTPKMGAMLMASGDMGCSEEILSIAAMLQLKNVWTHKRFSKMSASSGFTKSKQQDMKLLFAVLEGDHLTYLNVFNSFVLNQKDGNWCNEHCVEYRSLKRATEIRHLLKRYLVHFGVPMRSCKDDAVPVLKCLVKGYFANSAQIQPDGGYKTIRGDQRLRIHQSSIVHSEAIPWIVFDEVVQREEVYIHNVSAVKPTWIQEAAPHFYQFQSLSHDKEREIAAKRKEAKKEGKVQKRRSKKKVK